MDLRNNQPQQAPAPQQHPQAAAQHHGPKRGGSWLTKSAIGLALLAVVLGLGVIGSNVYASASTSRAANPKQFQALFLTNGQVYFGKLSNIDQGYVKLKDIYYLQIQQQVQPGQENKQGEQPQVSLAKLGGELHGPEDEMYVASEQVLFWENLKDDGKVAQAIKDYQANGEQK